MADQEAIQVTVILANVKQFRDKFYRLLSQQLAMHGVALRVVYSEPNSREALKGDCIDLAPDLGVKVPGYYFLGGRVLLQLPRPRDLISAKLIIVVQAAGYLLNYPLLLLSLCRLKKVAYWGHGWNRQGNPSSFAERSKRLLTKWCTWWFAYTDDTKARLTSLGFDPRRITVIENAIDTRGFRLDLDQVTAEELNAARSRHLLAESDCVALYCGSLYEEKRLTFLLDAAREISRSVSGFRLLIVGAGPGVAEIIRAQKEMPETLRYAGAMFGRDKAVFFRLARVFLNPGLVGLGILDCFAAGLPFVTSPDAKHSPEIAYLDDGVNGMFVKGGPKEYASAVSQLLKDDAKLQKLRSGALMSSQRYTVENMVQNVASGILSCLEISASGTQNRETKDS